MQTSLLSQLAISTVMVIATVVIHTYGLMFVSRLLRRHVANEYYDHHVHMTPHLVVKIVGIVLALFVVHGLEIWLYAFLYEFGGATKDFETALYYSTFSYSTAGYTDDQLHEGWRLVAAIESVNGFLMLGWSTAFFMTVVVRLRRG